MLFLKNNAPSVRQCAILFLPFWHFDLLYHKNVHSQVEIAVAGLIYQTDFNRCAVRTKRLCHVERM